MPEPSRYVLAIDLGTSGPKVALISERGEIAGAAARRVETDLLPSGGAEQDPDEIWSGIVHAVHQILAAARVQREAIVAVASTSQYFSLIPVDAEGRALTKLLVWMDGRGGRHALDLHHRHPEAFGHWLEVHGIPPLPSGGCSLSKMLWIQRDLPAIWERTRCVLEPVDWVLMRLTGRFTANVCTAFSMLLTDCRHLDRLAWDPALMAIAGVDSEKLPELVPLNSVVGKLRPKVAEELGLSPDTLVLSGTNDTQAAGVATATFRRGAGAVNVGSTGQILAHLDERRCDFARVLISMPSAITGRYMVMAENGLAGKSLDHFLHGVVFGNDAIADHRTPEPFAGLDRAVEAAPPGAGGVIFLPWLTGTVAPEGNARVRGAFVNLSLETDRSRMVRAILEGVAFSMRWLLPAVEELTEERFDELRFSGGGARSHAWAQIFADVLNRPVQPLADAVHSNNRASALLAFDALGISNLEEVDRFCPIRARLEPRAANRGVYDDIYGQFRATHEALNPIFDRFNQSS